MTTEERWEKAKGDCEKEGSGDDSKLDGTSFPKPRWK